MIMNAVILRVDFQSLLVRDEATGQEVLVHFGNARTFSVGDRIRIVFNGQMTLSIPPQITATSIQRVGTAIPAPQPPTGIQPTEMRAVVLQRGNNFLVVRNAQGTQMRVNSTLSRFFCPRQQIVVRYDTITLGNPPTVTATDIMPIC